MHLGENEDDSLSRMDFPIYSMLFLDVCGGWSHTCKTAVHL